MRYSFEDSVLTLDDPEIGLAFKEPFSPQRVPLHLAHVAAGETIQIDRSGDLIERILMVKSERADGECCQYDQNQKLKCRSFYREGKLHGPSRYFNEQGSLLQETWFVEGKREGRSMGFDFSGKVKEEKRYRKGKLEGEQKSFYSNGSVKTVSHYRDGKLDGTTTLYFANGKAKREISFTKGEKKGIERMWNGEGILIAEAEFNGNQRVGISRRWHENGTLAEEIKHHTHPAKFDVEQWNIDGKRLRKGAYTDDNHYLHQLWNDQGELVQERQGLWNGSQLVWN